MRISTLIYSPISNPIHLSQSASTLDSPQPISLDLRFTSANRLGPQIHLSQSDSSWLPAPPNTNGCQPGAKDDVNTTFKIGYVGR